MMEWLPMIIVWVPIICGIIGAAMLSFDNKAGIGFLLGLFLGPIGIFIAYIWRERRKKAEHDERISQKRHKEQMAAMSALKPEQKSVKPMRECPYCAEEILAKAKLCKHCGKEVEPIAV